ncbi:MAG: hypothetical protein ACXU9O_06720 [Gemmatimonadaceae bacterium]
MSHLSDEQLDQIIAEERSRLQAPLNEWRTIAARAREEGLIRETQASRWWTSSQPWLQSAAAVLLLIGGIAIGRATIALPSALPATASNPTPAIASATPSPASSNQSSLSSSGNATFASVDEASAALNRAVKDYQHASEFLAVSNGSSGMRDSLAMYSARAAALDKIENATVSALQTAPHDPVINQYYLATMGARVATQQQLAQPVGLRGF